MHLLIRISVGVIVLVAIIAGGFSAWAFLREQADRAELAPANGRFVQAGDTELFIQEIGSGERTAIVLHGMAAWSETWRPAGEALAQAGWRVILVDMPPFGFSERPADRGYWRVDGADRLYALTRTLELDNPLIVAHSYGSRAGFEALMRHPAAFRGIIAIDPALDEIYGESAVIDERVLDVFSHEVIRYPVIAMTLTNPLLAQTLLQLFMHKKEAATPAVLAPFRLPGSLRESTTDLGHWVYGFLSGADSGFSQMRGHFSSLGVPAVLIWGREDTTTPLTQGEELATLIPGSELVILDGVGHMPHIEDPAAFEAALIRAAVAFQ